MGGSASAVEVAVRSRDKVAPDAATGSSQGVFNGRPVVELPGVARGRFPRGIAQAAKNPGIEGESRVLGSRGVTVDDSNHGQVLPAGMPRRQGAALVAPTAQLRSGCGNESPIAPSGPPERQPGSRLTDLPWLTPAQNAKRRANDGLLVALLGRPDGLSDASRDKLQTAAELVQRAELEISRAFALLKRSRGELLSDAEWRELSGLYERNRADLPTSRALVQGALEGLDECDDLKPAQARLPRQLRRRLTAAGEFLNSPGVRWQEAWKRVETTLPIGPGKPVSVECRVVPGALFGPRFPFGYPPADWTDPHWLMELSHVSDLAQSTLVNARGETLFSGLRHGLIGSDKLGDGGFLERLGDGELRTLADVVLVRGRIPEPRGPHGAVIIDEIVREVAHSPRAAGACALKMCEPAWGNMARETATAALVANPAKFHRALAGERVNIDLFSVAVLRARNFVKWRFQSDAFESLSAEGERSPIALRVRDLDGAAQTVLADIHIWQFLFLVGEAVSSSMLYFNDGADRLLGTRDYARIGGYAGARIDAMSTRVAKLGDFIDALERDHARICEERGADDRDALAVSCRVDKVKNERERLRRNVRTLMELVQRLKARWMAGSGDCALYLGGGTKLQAASWLALGGYLMGATPLLSSTDRELTERLVADVQLLAVAADCNEGYPPPMDRNTPAWEAARGEFARR